MKILSMASWKLFVWQEYNLDGFSCIRMYADEKSRDEDSLHHHNYEGIDGDIAFDV